jgi:hypothetical protein
MVGYEKFDQNRGSVGHARALRTGSMKNVDLQPALANSAGQVPTENGFAADDVIANPHDAQSQQTTSAPVAKETEPAPVVPTTATPPEGGTTESVTCENSPTGSLDEARYPSLIPSATPVGYPSA